MAAADRVHAGEHLLIFVGPAGVVEEAIDGGRDFGSRIANIRALLDQFVDELLRSPFQHLGDAIENLPAVVRASRARPTG